MYFLKKIDVLRHCLFLQTFKYSKIAASYKLCEELYQIICAIYQLALIPVTKSKERIIGLIKELESKRNQINRKRSGKRITKLNENLYKIFPVIKKMTNVL